MFANSRRKSTEASQAITAESNRALTSLFLYYHMLMTLMWTEIPYDWLTILFELRFVYAFESDYTKGVEICIVLF